MGVRARVEHRLLRLDHSRSRSIADDKFVAPQQPTPGEWRTAAALGRGRFGSLPPRRPRRDAGRGDRGCTAARPSTWPRGSRPARPPTARRSSPSSRRCGPRTRRPSDRHEDCGTVSTGSADKGPRRVGPCHRRKPGRDRVNDVPILVCTVGSGCVLPGPSPGEWAAARRAEDRSEWPDPRGVADAAASSGDDGVSTSPPPGRLRTRPRPNRTAPSGNAASGGTRSAETAIWDGLVAAPVRPETRIRDSLLYPLWGATGVAVAGDPAAVPVGHVGAVLRGR